MACPAIACSEKQRLLLEFTRAVSDYHRMQSAQLASLVRDAGFSFEREIAAAAQRRENAKYALIAHQEEHGCWKTTVGQAA
jgi:hypothetical protein